MQIAPGCVVAFCMERGTKAWCEQAPVCRWDESSYYKCSQHGDGGCIDLPQPKCEGNPSCRWSDACLGSRWTARTSIPPDLRRPPRVRLVPHPFPKLIPDMPATRLTRIGVGAGPSSPCSRAPSAARGALEPPGADMAATLRELLAGSRRISRRMSAPHARPTPCRRSWSRGPVPFALRSAFVMTHSAGAFGFEAGAALVGRECGRARPHRGSRPRLAARGSLAGAGRQR